MWRVWVSIAVAIILGVTVTVVGRSQGPTYHHVDPGVLPVAPGAQLLGDYDEAAVDQGSDHNYYRELVIAGPAQLTDGALEAAEARFLLDRGWAAQRPTRGGGRQALSPDRKVVASSITAATGTRGGYFELEVQRLLGIARTERRPAIVVTLIPLPSPNPH